MLKEWLRSIPAVHELQNHGEFLKLLKQSQLDYSQLTKQLKDLIEQIREAIIMGKWQGAIPGTNHFIDELFIALNANVKKQFSYTIERVINATGTILHTN